MSLQLDLAAEVYQEDDEKSEAATIRQQSKDLLVRLGHQRCHRPDFSLPDDVLLEIFEHLGTLELHSCNQVNHQWREVIQLKPSLWVRKVELWGTYQQVAQQWNYISAMHRGTASVKSMSIFIHSTSQSIQAAQPTNRNIEFYFYSLICSLPIETLESFTFIGKSYVVDMKVWNQIQLCKKLRRFLFSTSSPRRYDDYIPQLILCDLQVLDVNCDFDHKSPFYQNSNGLRVLALKSRIDPYNIRNLLVKSAPSLEYVHVSGIRKDARYSDWDPQETLYSVVLPRLKVFEIVNTLIRAHIEGCKLWDNYKIQTPNLTDLKYINCAGWDRRLVKSCNRNLKRIILTVEWLNYHYIYWSLSTFDVCEELMLEYVDDYDHSGWLAKLECLFAGDYQYRTTTPCMSLKKLKKLTIAQNIEIEGDALLRFVEYKRTTAGCDPLQDLTLIGCPEVSRKTLDQLCGIPGLQVVYSP